MTEQKPMYVVVEEPPMTRKQIAALFAKIRRVIDEPGYGEISVVIRDGRVFSFKTSCEDLAPKE